MTAEPPAATPAAQAPVATPVATPAPAAAPKPAADDVARRIPVPTPANVPPLTIDQIGEVPLSPVDQAVADGLRDLLAGRGDRFVGAATDRAALKAFYEARKFAPLFSEFGKPNARMKAAVARLAMAEADGLDPDDYATPALAAGGGPEALAEAELRLQNALLTFARHAQSGRVDAARISPNIDVRPPVPETARVLARLAGAKDIAAALDGFNPPHEGFRRLRARLAELRKGPEEEVPVMVPEGRLMREGMQDERVPVLRQRLKVEGDAADTTFDAALTEAVKEFQRANKLNPDGVVGTRTVQVLNGGRTTASGKPVDTIISNMERWRWLPRDLGAIHVMANVPDFTLRMMRNGKSVFDSRIVVGRPGHPTPIFSDAIETIQINPTWHVPQSIIYNDYLPALERDPGVLQRMGLILTHNPDGTISVRQPPGDQNALGRLKFNFPNKFQVYMHDTPQRHLFGQTMRAHSAGCVRVQNPEMFGERLLAVAMPGEGFTAQKLTARYGPDEQWIRFKNEVQVHIVYMNAFVDDAGELVIRPDVYGYDGRVQSALKGRYMVVDERSQVVNPTEVRRDYQMPVRRFTGAQPGAQPGTQPGAPQWRPFGGGTNWQTVGSSSPYGAPIYDGEGRVVGRDSLMR